MRAIWTKTKTMIWYEIHDGDDHGVADNIAGDDLAKLNGPRAIPATDRGTGLRDGPGRYAERITNTNKDIHTINHFILL
jgi:hypothetical protein